MRDVCSFEDDLVATISLWIRSRGISIGISIQ